MGKTIPKHENVNDYMQNDNMIISDNDGILYFTAYARVITVDGVIPVQYNGGAYYDANMSIVKSTIITLLKTSFASALKIELIQKSEYDKMVEDETSLPCSVITNHRKFIEAF